MKSRHRAREIALQILYRFDVAAHISGKPLSSQAQELSGELAQELEGHFKHFQVSPELQDFTAQLVNGTLNELPRLDSLLESHVSNWRLARLGFVDRSLLRLAAYELLFLGETPTSVVIDEAVELGKQFGTAETPAFVNGILDALKTSSRSAS